ncbi:MAG: TonB-dependent receptor [Sphingomonadaceae bacterium]|nr:TonB-dependent receptor [Sphingomonadaceae bacterium]
MRSGSEGRNMISKLDIRQPTRILPRLLGAASVLAIAAAPAPARAETQPAADAAAAATAATQPAAAQPADAAQPAAQPGATADQTAEPDIVVTGFRASLNAALNLKRESVSSVDAIVAEDIARFPDQNLAEALQRIPGIAIQRDAGEGRAITVRGLSAQFTRVRINNMEAITTSSDGAAANRDRQFDFNVFASELFTSVVVHKTAEASLDEGSLGAVVDLNTGNPRGNHPGFTFAVSAQGAYNDLSNNVAPRVAGLIGYRNPEGTVAASISAAYSHTDTLELGNNTVRWAQARFDSVNGTPCFFTTAASNTPAPNSGGVYRSSAACDQAALAFHPRIPRYGSVRHDRERLGLTGSIQLEPNPSTHLSIDGLYSRFTDIREEKWGEVLLRSNERSIDLVNFTVDANNTMTTATLNDAWVRTEHFYRRERTTFYQLGGSWDQDVADNFRFTLLGGFSKSDADVPRETTIIFDDRDAQNYQFDYTDSRYPRLTFGTSVTTPGNFQLAEIRDRPNNVTNTFQTAQLRTEADISSNVKMLVGGVYRRYHFQATGFLRDTAVCGNGGTDLVLGTLTCSPSSLFGPTAVYGFPVTSALAETFHMGRAGQPSGNTNDWVVANLDAATAFTHLYGRPLLLDVGNNRSVTEAVWGAYGQLDAHGTIGSVRYAFNAGVRWVRTNQSSTGINSNVVVSVDRRYDDVLPAANLVIYPSDNIILRAAVAKVITRPSLGNLTPGGSADGFNLRVSYGNPFLNPFRAWAYDLGFEYYFAPQSIFSVALFRKEISSFPVAQNTTGSFDSTGLPVSVLVASSPAALNPAIRAQNNWTITTVINGTGATLNGVEVAVQAPFKFLPGFWSNFGGILNGTYVDSSATYLVSGPAITPGGALVSTTRQGTLFGLSKWAANGTLYYDDGTFSARVSVSYRSRYADANSGTGNVFEGYNRAINVDAAIRYQINRQIEVSLEGINLTDAYRDRFTDIDANRIYENDHFGRTITLGARFRL